MKKQLFLLMLGVAFASTSSVFAMDLSEDNNSSTLSKLYAPNFLVLDIETAQDLNSDISKLQQGQCQFITAPSGNLYSVHSVDRSFEDTCTYLMTPRSSGGIGGGYPTMLLMQKEKVVTNKRIRFLYKGGTYTVSSPNRYNTNFCPLEMTFQQQEIVFKRIDKDQYDKFFQD